MSVIFSETEFEHVKIFGTKRIENSVVKIKLEIENSSLLSSIEKDVFERRVCNLEYFQRVIVKFVLFPICLSIEDIS